MSVGQAELTQVPPAPASEHLLLGHDAEPRTIPDKIRFSSLSGNRTSLLKQQASLCLRNELWGL